MISTNPSAEPREQITDDPKTQQVFGIDVEGLGPGQDAVIDATAPRLPARQHSGRSRPASTAWQALLHKYETFHRARRPHREAADGPWRGAAGGTRHRATSTARPAEVEIDPKKGGGRSAVALDKVIPPIPDPPTTRYIKHEKIQSEAAHEVSGGRPMFLGAHILLPEGFRRAPRRARYPLVIFHGHHPQTFSGFREEPPDPDLKPDYSERFQSQRI